MKTKERQIWMALLLVAILVIFFQRSCCKKEKPGKEVIVKTDTLKTIVHDSTEIYMPPMTVYKPSPLEIIHDTMRQREIDTVKVLGDYFASRLYMDTVKVKEGEVIIHDEISRNRIQLRQVFTNLEQKTIVKTIGEKKKGQLYLGVNVYGGNIFAAGPSLMLKTKKDKIYEIGALYTDQGKWIYGAGVKFKIHF